MTKEEKQEYKYKAFICHSHKDEKWGKWLQRVIERFKFPKSLIGRNTIYGNVPKKITQLYRGKESKSNSAYISDYINNALIQSSHLIVICSPNSAASHWVNELVKRFKKFGKENRILCLIIDGEPNADNKPELNLQECFPPAIKVRADKDGNLTDIPSEPLAADAREVKDGLFNSKLKILSGLTGVGFDEIFQRDEKRRKRKLITTSLVFTFIAPILMLTLSYIYDSIFWYYAMRTDDRVSRSYIPEYTVWINTTNITEKASIQKTNKKNKNINVYNTLGFYLISTGSFSFDELRIGTTFESVIPGNENDTNNLLYEPFVYESGKKVKKINGWDSTEGRGKRDNYIVREDSIKYGNYKTMGNRIYSPNSYITSKIRFSLINSMMKTLPEDIDEIFENKQYELIRGLQKEFTEIENNLIKFNHIFYSFYIRPEGALNQGAHNGYFYFSMDSMDSESGFCFGKSPIRHYDINRGYFSKEFYKGSFYRHTGQLKPFISREFRDYPMYPEKSYFVIISCEIKQVVD